MSLIPASGGAHQAWAHAWETIRYAIDSNARTARLAILLLVISLSSIPPLLIMELIRHLLG